MTADDREWKEKLTPEQYEVCRLGGTERAFTGKYYNEKTPGMYHCAACVSPLFSSETKFESGTGWPSFYDVAASGTVELLKDSSHGMIRTEVRCKQCGSHLGHLFDDGPRPTGQRYCINSLSLVHEKDRGVSAAQEQPTLNDTSEGPHRE